MNPLHVSCNMLKFRAGTEKEHKKDSDLKMLSFIFQFSYRKRESIPCSNEAFIKLSEKLKSAKTSIMNSNFKCEFALTRHH